MKNYKQIMLAGLLFSVALMGCSASAVQNQTAVDEAGKDQTADGVSTLAGEEKIAGRTCDVYSVTVQFVNFEQTFRYSIDQETGVCLRLESEKNISGVEIDGEEGFSCERFDTEEIDLRKEFTTNI